MSTLKQPSTAITEVTEASIAAWLQANPDFFERNLTLLGKLRLPHQTGGPAVSLLERQVTVLRQRNVQLERQLKDLVEVARGNDELAAKVHQLAMLLMAARERAEVISIVEQQLRLSFNADQAVLILFAADNEPASSGRFVRVIARDAAEIAPFRTFLQSSAPRCGQVRDSQRDFLFGAGTVEIGSVALLPLGRESVIGFLAIGNRDAGHFHPGKGIDFLVRLGDMVAAALARD